MIHLSSSFGLPQNTDYVVIILIENKYILSSRKMICFDECDVHQYRFSSII